MLEGIRQINRRLVVAVVASAVAVLAVGTVAVAGPGGSSKRPSGVSVSVDACSASPTVTWSGFSTAAVRVYFEQIVDGEDVAEAESALVPVIRRPCLMSQTFGCGSPDKPVAPCQYAGEVKTG
mgnify:CR=1 FL=1